MRLAIVATAAILCCSISASGDERPARTKRIQKIIIARQKWLAESLASERQVISAQFEEQLKDRGLQDLEERLDRIDALMGGKITGAEKRKLTNEAKKLKSEISKTKKRLEKTHEEIRQERATALADLDRQYRSKESDPDEIPRLDMHFAEVGDVGRIRRYFEFNLEIVQVINGENALARQFPAGDGKGAQSFWLSGISTEGLTDGEKITYLKPVEVVGTKQYETASGAARTVLLLKPFDPEELRPYLERE